MTIILKPEVVIDNFLKFWSLLYNSITVLLYKYSFQVYTLIDLEDNLGLRFSQLHHENRAK